MRSLGEEEPAFTQEDLAYLPDGFPPSELLQRPERIETDARGQVMIAPTPDFIHSGFPESWLVELEGCSRPAALQINIL